MENWRKAWRKGLAPLLNVAHLEALRTALLTDTPTLLQGATTKPPPLQCVQDWPVEAGCAITYCGWKGDSLPTVAAAEEFFAKICFEMDRLLEEPSACRWFLNWFDDTPRDEMRRQLLPEVSRSIALAMKGSCSDNEDPASEEPGEEAAEVHETQPADCVT